MKVNLMTSLVKSAKGQLSSAMACARLFYNYLRLSPSYAAGCLHKARGVGQKLNRHGAKVLACVDKYRDVHQTSFDDWVKGAGRFRADMPSLLPELQTSKTLATNLGFSFKPSNCYFILFFKSKKKCIFV
jgi:hypothetical protein